MVSPRLVDLNRDAFVVDRRIESSVDLDGHRADSALDELDLGDVDDPDAGRSQLGAADQTDSIRGTG
jgi:hypothetical protein